MSNSILLINSITALIKKISPPAATLQPFYKATNWEDTMMLVRHYSLLSINNLGDTSMAYAGLFWELEMKSGMFLNLGAGAAVHDGKLETSEEDKKRLGSRVLFRIPIEFGYELNKRHRVSIAFDHVSNASLAHPNEGLDTFGLRYGYRF